jgi:hypothetical protein
MIQPPVSAGWPGPSTRPEKGLPPSRGAIFTRETIDGISGVVPSHASLSGR